MRSSTKTRLGKLVVVIVESHIKICTRFESLKIYCLRELLNVCLEIIFKIVRDKNGETEAYL